jgi:hypothetical protein
MALLILDGIMYAALAGLVILASVKLVFGMRSFQK